MEVLAKTQALKFAPELGFWAVEIEGDFLVVIMKLRATCIDQSKISNHIWEAKQIVLGFEICKFQHIKRGGNRVTHLLAKDGFRRKCDVWWVDDDPTMIQGLVEEEGQFTL
ncbi:hypothetical protein PVK06_026868 [Gossypium arboreum]|uniref:RNase H type-1 domain-containing protein n=1 Tax=Gossypium arboreum TaxID=29729 RepID=A0ABR0NYT8_GOSAR|nr:hypothetical protein PVK06_026868 [Gossypium arboreum]